MTFHRNFVAAVLTLLIVAYGVSANAQVTLPETFAGRHFAAFTKAFNSGDEEQFKAWLLTDAKAVDSTEVYERRFQFMQRFSQNLGGIEIKEVMESEEYTITALVKAVAPQGMMEWLIFTFSYDSVAPHGLLGIGLQPGEDPEDRLPDGELTDEMLTAYLDEYIDKLDQRERFSGAVLIANDGKPFYTKAVGLASKRYNIPNQLDTKFNLGSMNKMFTGVAIAQLAQQGKLSFDDPVGKFLPDYPNAEVAEKVTIHHLLTHTSGMSDYWEELFDARFWEIKTVQQLADLTAEKPLDFEPGAQFQYSNAGPVVLGLIIEKITGQSYYEYVRENIYQPAGMINTDCYEIDKPVPNLAIGYTRMNYDGSRLGDGWRNNLMMHAGKGGPAGGGYSTVEDLLRFDIALRGHKLLNETYTDTVITGKVEMMPHMKYAYLFGDEDVEGERIVGHNGGAPGISAQLDMYWTSGYTVAVLANYDGAAGMMATKLNQVIRRRMGQNP